MALCIELVFACSAGGPGFNSRLRRFGLGFSMQRMKVALVKPLQSYYSARNNNMQYIL
jgi:hypothetical protein